MTRRYVVETATPSLAVGPRGIGAVMPRKVGSRPRVRVVSLRAPHPAQDTWTRTIGEIYQQSLTVWPRLRFLGVFNCKRVNNAPPPAEWSQHAYEPGRAIDLGVPDEPYQRRVVKWLRKHWGDRIEIIWNDAVHLGDHVHVHLLPKRTSTPACAG